MRFYAQEPRNGSHRTVWKFYWWPAKVWDCERQAHITLWMERARVIQWRIGGRWKDDILWYPHHGEPEDGTPEFTPEVRRVFRELGVE